MSATNDALRALLKRAEERSQAGAYTNAADEIHSALAMLAPRPSQNDPKEAWRRSFAAVCRRIVRSANGTAGAQDLHNYIVVANELIDLRERLEAADDANTPPADGLTPPPERQSTGPESKP